MRGTMGHGRARPPRPRMSGLPTRPVAMACVGCPVDGERSRLRDGTPNATGRREKRCRPLTSCVTTICMVTDALVAQRAELASNPGWCGINPCTQNLSIQEIRKSGAIVPGTRIVVARRAKRRGIRDSGGRGRRMGEGQLWRRGGRSATIAGWPCALPEKRPDLQRFRMLGGCDGRRVFGNERRASFSDR